MTMRTTRTMTGSGAAVAVDSVVTVVSSRAGHGGAHSCSLGLAAYGKAPRWGHVALVACPSLGCETSGSSSRNTNHRGSACRPTNRQPRVIGPTRLATVIVRIAPSPIGRWASTGDELGAAG